MELIIPPKLIPVALAASALFTAALVILAARCLLRAFMSRRRTRVEVEEAGDRGRGRGLMGGSMGQLLGPVARFFKPTAQEELAGLRLKLAQAGLSSQSAVDHYARVQVFSLMLAALLAVPWFFTDEPGLLLLGLSACTGVGVLLPRFWLSLRTSKWRERISHALASTLDLMVTCMEAGLGLEQAVERVASELEYSDPEMAEELGITINEMRAGIPIAQAFRKLALRVALEEMHMLCTVIVQASSLGASVGNMLRQYAASWRVQRMLDLEEKAGKMTAALTLPLTLCLLPSAILAMLGPAILVVLRNLG